MKYVIIQKTNKDMDYSNDIFKDILKLYPDYYPVCIKVAEYSSVAEGHAYNPAYDIMEEEYYLKYKADLDEKCKYINLALKAKQALEAAKLRYKHDKKSINKKEISKLNKEFKKALKACKNDIKTSGVFVKKPWWKLF